MLLGEVVTRRAARRHDVRRPRHRLERQLRVLHLQVRAGDRAGPRGRCGTATQLVTVAGHINEAGDVFAEDYPFPEVEEGEVVAILNAGGYLAGHVVDPLPAADGVGGVPRAGGAAHDRAARAGPTSRADACRTRSAGSGSGVVLAHAGIADMRQWDPQWAALTARHRVVRYDLRGFGRADVVETPLLQPRGPGRGDGRRRPRSRGARRVLARRGRSPSTPPWNTRIACRASSGSAVASAASRARRRPRSWPPFEREEALYEAKDWEAMADVRRGRSGSTASASPRVGRRQRRARRCAG